MECHESAGHRQVEAADASTARVVGSTWHGDRDDPVTALTHRWRQTVVLTAEQQHIAMLEHHGLQLHTAITAAADQTALPRELAGQILEILMGGDRHVGPVIETGSTKAPVIDLEAKGLD